MMGSNHQSVVMKIYCANHNQGSAHSGRQWLYSSILGHT